jgi:hypothetical protein
MKTQSLLRPLFALFSLALPVTLQAKEKSPGHAGSIQFSCATWDTLPNPELFYHHGGEYLPIELSAGQRSKAYPLKGVVALELFIHKATIAAAAESNAAGEYERVGTAPLPPDAKRILFLIDAKKDANGLPLRVLGIDDSLEIFPVGSFRFFNQTPDLLRIEFAGATHDLPQGSLKVVTPELPEAGGFLPVVIKNEQGGILLENRFLAQRTVRELVIIGPPAEGRTGIAIQSLSEIIPASPPSTQKSARNK